MDASRARCTSRGGHKYGGIGGDASHFSFTFSVVTHKGWTVLDTGALGVASVNLFRVSCHGIWVDGWMDMRGAPRHGFEQRAANNGGAK